LLDEQSGVSKSPATYTRGANSGNRNAYSLGGALIGEPAGKESLNYGDTGGASRFFAQLNYGPDDALRFYYCAKVSRAERNAGLEGIEEQVAPYRQVNSDWKVDIRSPDGGYKTAPQSIRQNNHPTVKPLALMRYLITLVTRPEHVVLDPFMGSGSTGRAAIELGRGFIGIDKERDAYEIAKRRIADAQRQPQLSGLEGTR
ncbi:unnamed protein product, partial [marine sediment metagenome]